MKWSVIEVMKTKFPSRISTAAVTLCGAQCVGCFLPAWLVPNTEHTKNVDSDYMANTRRNFSPELSFRRFSFSLSCRFSIPREKHTKKIGKTAKYVNKSTRKIILCLVSLMYIWHRGLYLYMIIMLGEKLILFVHKASIYVWSASKQYRFVLCIIQPEGIKKANETIDLLHFFRLLSLIFMSSLSLWGILLTLFL